MNDCKTLTLCCFPFLLATVLPACSSNGGSSTEDLLEKCVLASKCSLAESETLSLGTVCNLFSTVEGMESQDDSTSTKIISAMISCMMTATTCDQVLACVKASESEAQVCQASGDNNRCSGNVMVECSGNPDEVPDAFDCTAAGLVCAESESDAECGEAICTAGADSRCEGHLLVKCDDVGVEMITDCHVYTGYHCSGGAGDLTCQTRAGGTCGTDPEDGELACVGTGETCDDEMFENHCDGSVMVTCNRGKESRLDCQDLHRELTCGVDAQLGVVNCKPVLDECQLTTDESCEAGTITFCLMGKITELDCTKYGSSGCSSNMIDNRTVAFCVD